ncbi:BamA/TamA family outer membrane protein [Neolewinella agarilytica]|uniref:Surface antigen n=1 Tax=Neolewinella agarilytica TaxID=478744 RepID=A0A1H9CVG4_9BACT|nr:BamA/TamA family outer membrane protein [Neolewinella agarilytica]SEQ05129.1 Surface antigen [Neolewinella agarilytica]
MLHSTRLTLLCLLLSSCLSAQVRLIVAGNTADAVPGLFEAIDLRIQQADLPATVLFAGDFVDGCTEEMSAWKRKQGNGDQVFSSLAPLLDLVRRNPETDFYFIPGDRDWDKSGVNGLACVKAMENYLEDQLLDNLIWPLKNGCPGPELIQLSESVLLMPINTQWWNHPHHKPLPAESSCDFADPGTVLDEMKSIFQENRDRNIIVAGHFPPKSQGRYGGEFPARDHFAPPIIGGIRLSWRQNVGTPEELTNERFAPLAKAMKDYNGFYDGLLFVGAQDKSQQLIRFRRNFILNAGASGPGRWSAQHKPAQHISREAGFTEITFSEDGEVNYIYLDAKDAKPLAERILYHAPCDNAQDTLPVNPAFRPCGITEEDMTEFKVDIPDSQIVVPGAQYEVSKFGENFLGKHYRDTWATPVKVPVLDVSTAFGGLTPEREGGGRQTTSLKLRSEDGTAYIFRSIDKDPAVTLDWQIRPTIIGDAFRDQTSSGHPFGSLIVAPLLDHLGVLHVSPQVYSMAACPTLGNFNPRFANMLGTLEVFPQDEKQKSDRPGTFGADDILKSYELFRERYDDQEVVVNNREFLRARLFDLLIGDWSRHEENWKWASYKIGGVHHIRPIPRDRDNAFSRMDGFFPWFASRSWAVPNLENFGFRTPDIRSLSHQARHMDRLLLSPLKRTDFEREAQKIQTELTDEIIEQAVKQMPAGAFAVSGEEIIAKLKRRRDDLQDYAEAYYELYASVVDIVGTNDEEAFTAEGLSDGSLRIRSVDLKGKSEGMVLYDRVFSPKETKEVRVYGLGDDDQFTITGENKSSIKLRFIGGEGEDIYTAESTTKSVKASIYENDREEEIVSGNGLKYKNNWRDELYYYDRTAHEYNEISPLVSVGFNGFSGPKLGLGVQFTRRNFTRRDFSARYRIAAEARAIGSAAVKASAEFGEVFGKADLIARTRAGFPDFFNFFYGLGNNTVIDPDRVRNDFNLIRLKHFSVEGGLRRRFAGRSYFNLLAGYQINETIETENTILNAGTDYYGDGNLRFAYLRPELQLDLRDHPQLPSKGVMLEASQKWGFGDFNNNFGVSKIAGETHFSTRRFPISLSFRTGLALTQGTVPFYEQPSLGRANGLRGFQRNRFVGDGYFFYNVEFRSPVALIESRVVPFAVGVRTFYDRGVILQKSEEARDFKSAYGFGIYLIPLSRSFTVSAVMGFTKEEASVINVSAGTNF